jgi:hypothetical protein
MRMVILLVPLLGWLLVVRYIPRRAESSSWSDYQTVANGRLDEILDAIGGHNACKPWRVARRMCFRLGQLKTW